MRKPDVELHIESLVLHGVTPGDRTAVAEGVRAELARLIAERGFPAGLSAADGAAVLDGGSFRSSPGQRPAGVGAAVANAVYGSTGR